MRHLSLIAILLAVAGLALGSDWDVGTGPTPYLPGAVAVTGGSIDGAPIGATTPSSGKFTSVTDTGLTATRVPFVGTAGLLQDDGGMVRTGTAASPTVTYGDGTGSPTVAFNGPSGSDRGFKIFTGGSIRWQISGEGTPETGGNVGSGINFNCFDDNGFYLGTPLQLFRIAGSSVQANYPLYAAAGLKIPTAANGRMGTATLNGSGTVTVSNTSVTASTRFFLTPHGSTIAAVGVSAVSAGVSFTLKSSSGSDANTVDYLLVEPGP